MPCGSGGKLGRTSNTNSYAAAALAVALGGHATADDQTDKATPGGSIEKSVHAKGFCL